MRRDRENTVLVLLVGLIAGFMLGFSVGFAIRTFLSSP